MVDTQRHPFGGGIGDWVLETSEGGLISAVAGVTVQFHNARDGGTVYTDLAADEDGTTPVTSVVSQDGTTPGYALGDYPIVYGPPGVLWMYASADGGPRKIMFANDIPEIVQKAILADLVIGKGDLLVATGAGAVDRLAVGATGQVLTADSTQEAGMRWATPTGGGGGGGVATTSDMLWVAAADAPSQFDDAPYQCDGSDDQVTINTALANAFGLRVGLSPGTFHLSGPVQLLGVDDVDVEVSRYLQGSGTYATRLAADPGVSAAVVLGNAVCPYVSDLSIEVSGATHGIYATRSLAAGAGNRSFWHGTIERVAVKGPWDGTHTGWAMSLGSGFRYSVDNVEVSGTGNGIRVLNETSEFNCGDATFRRIFVEIIGAGGVAYHVSSPAGNANQLSFDTCHAIAQTADAGTVCWLFDGAGSTSHVRTTNCNAEQFATTVSIAGTAYDVDVDLVHVTLRNGSTLASVAGYSSRVRCGLVYVEPGAVVSAVTETNGYDAKPNQFDFDVYADTGATVNATLTTGRVSRGLADGDAATIAGVLRYKPVGGRTFTFVATGTLANGVGGVPIYNDTGNDLILRSARDTVNTAYTTGTVITDININGASIFTNPAHRPTIAVNQTTSGRVTTGIAGVLWPAGARLTVDIDQVGSAGGPGANGILTAQIDTY